MIPEFSGNFNGSTRIPTVIRDKEEASVEIRANPFRDAIGETRASARKRGLRFARESSGGHRCQNPVPVGLGLSVRFWAKKRKGIDPVRPSRGLTFCSDAACDGLDAGRQGAAGSAVAVADVAAVAWSGDEGFAGGPG